MIYEQYSEPILIQEFNSNSQIADMTIIQNDLSCLQIKDKIMHGVEFISSSLISAEIHSSDIDNLTARMTNMNNLKVVNTRESGFSLSHCSFIKASLSDSVLLDSSLYNCDMPNASFTRTRIISTTFSGCALYRCRFVNTIMINSSFLPRNDHGSYNMQGSLFSGVTCIDSDFTNMNMDNVIFRNSRFIRCNFSNTMLPDDGFDNSSFIGCIFNNTRVKTGL